MTGVEYLEHALQVAYSCHRASKTSLNMKTEKHQWAVKVYDYSLTFFFFKSMYGGLQQLEK